MTNESAPAGQLVVARFLDGRVLKGTTLDFAPGKDKFHLIPHGDLSAVRTEIPVGELKALFFVKSWYGDAHHQYDNSFEGSIGQGRRISVTFTDGEVLAGYTIGYGPDKPGFFVISADSKGNNTRAFVVRKALKDIAWVPAVPV